MVDGVTYRLWGIDAPESAQPCADGRPAGKAATEHLRALQDSDCRLWVLVPGLSHQRGQHASASDVVEV